MLKMKCPLRIMLIFLIASGVRPDIHIEQPPVLTAALDQDVTLLCHLRDSSGRVNSTILYWDRGLDEQRQLVRGDVTEMYKTRVDRLHNDLLDLSIRLKRVQWEDCQKYLCKVSVTTLDKDNFRRKGQGTELLIYGELFFHATSLNSSDIECSVSVSSHPAFALSIYSNDQILNSTSGQNSTALFVGLSRTSHWEYECSLSFNGTRVTSRVYQHQHSDPSALDRDYPQPWSLYIGPILVKVVFLLAVSIALLWNSCP